jgi:hypothetical protein
MAPIMLLVPVVVLALPGGALSGRLGARRTMLACDLARAPLLRAPPSPWAQRAAPTPAGS